MPSFASTTFPGDVFIEGNTLIGQSGDLHVSGVIYGKYREAIKVADFTLARSDNGARFVCTAALTVTVPAVGTLGDGFECEIIADGVAVTIDGPGATDFEMVDGDVICLLEANGKQRAVGGASTVIS